MHLRAWEVGLTEAKLYRDDVLASLNGDVRGVRAPKQYASVRVLNICVVIYMCARVGVCSCMYKRRRD